MQEATSPMGLRQSTPANQAKHGRPSPRLKNSGEKQTETCQSWNKFTSNSLRSAEHKNASCRNGSAPPSSADQRIDEPPSGHFDSRRITLVRMWRREIVLQRPLRPSPSFAATLRNLAKKLEADAQTKLHLTGGVDLPFQSTPIVRFADDEAGIARIEHLIMVEHVREDGRKLQMIPFRDHYVLLDA